MRSIEVRLFVYGTLMEPAVVARLTGRPATMRPARLHGFVRVRLPGTAYATLRQGRGSVGGALVLTDRRGLRRLQAYEGRRYRLTPVRPRVAGGRKAVGALAWIARSGTRQPWP